MLPSPGSSIFTLSLACFCSDPCLKVKISTWGCFCKCGRKYWLQMWWVGPWVRVYTGERYDLPLMSPSGLVTLDLCVVSGTGHLSWLPLCQIPCSAVCLPWSLSFPLDSLGWLQLFTLLGSLKWLTPLLHTLYVLCLCFVRTFCTVQLIIS